MTLEVFLIIFTHNNFLIPKLFFISLSLFLIKPLFKWVIKDLWPNGYEPFDIFKVQNKFIHWLLIFIYIFIFIILLFIFRLYRIGREFDLKPFISYCKELIIDKEYSFIFMLILGALIFSLLFIGIMKRLKNRLELEILKRHLILHYKSYIDKKHYYSNIITFFFMLIDSHYKSNMGVYSEKTKGFYCLLQQIFLYCFGKGKIVRMLSSPFIFFADLAEEFDYQKSFFDKICEYATKFWSKILSLIYFSSYNLLIVVYDMYYNNLVLVKIFYFLPIYFIYLLWYKINSFLLDKQVIHSWSLCEILYNNYYCKNKVKYLFLTREYTKIVTFFIRLGLIINDEFTGCDVASTSRLIIYKCQYELEENSTNIYINRYTNRTFKIIEKDGKQEIIEMNPGTVKFL